MEIPIQNIYYLLCYAWNKLNEKNRVNVSIDGKTTLIDLFARILITGCKILLKRGIDRSYVSCSDEVAGIKGKLQLTATLKRNLLPKQKTVCTYDEFSPNILINRILITTLKKLIITKELNKELRYELSHLYRMFGGIEEIELSPFLFRQIILNRNNQFYGFIMNVCQIIFENTLPAEKKGALTFSDFTRDDRQMNRLFEAFIKNFYRLEQNTYKVKSEIIDWQFTHTYPSNEFLPQMKTDITLENTTEKIIIDAKFYRETMVINYGRKKIKSTHLYQLFSYLLNQEDENPKTTAAKGILIYPTIQDDYNLEYTYQKHPIHIRTLNLNTDWRFIDERLKAILEI